MQSLTELNKLVELLLMLAYHGIGIEDGDVSCAKKIPGKEAHNEGLSVKHSGFYNVMEEADLDIMWVLRKTTERMERLMERERRDH